MLKGIGKNSSLKLSSGIGLAYQIKRQNEGTVAYHQKAALLSATLALLSAALGIAAILQGWYVLGVASLFCSGCASQALNLLIKFLPVTQQPKTKHPHSCILGETSIKDSPHSLIFTLGSTVAHKEESQVSNNNIQDKIRLKQ